jgi:hypothetical protein
VSVSTEGPLDNIDLPPRAALYFADRPSRPCLKFCSEISAMSKIAEIFGFDRKKLWWYRDIALGTVASITALWGVVSLYVEHSNFDTRIGILSVAVSIACCAISPNRLVLFGVVFGGIASRGWFALLVTRDPRSWWIATPATVALVVLLAVFRNRPVKT